jgi:hypothetical protein
MAKKPALTLVGPRVGGPTIQDIVALFKSLTGREPEPADVEKAKAILARGRLPSPSP